MSGPTRVLVATGTRAEFGLLAPVMRAVAAHPALELVPVVAGAHLLGPSFTHREVSAAFDVAATVPMQREGETGCVADAAALGRGIAGFAGVIGELRPRWVVVLGDRIEALAAAAAGSVAGVRVAHLHGGDRAEGVADEAIRHAITKLAHLHLAATEASAARIVRMGEPEETVRVVGSPAIDGLADMPAMDDAAFEGLGRPEVVLLLHPCGRDPEQERHAASATLAALARARVLALHPNFDAGREGIIAAIDAAASSGEIRAASHLVRDDFVGLLKRLAGKGAIVGNSSAGLIEAAALGVACVNIGPRQHGRERFANVIDAATEAENEIREAVTRALTLKPDASAHGYGDGRAGERAAAVIAGADGSAGEAPVRKRCAY